MKTVSYVVLSMSLLALSACSDLTGNEKLQALQKEMGADSSEIRICCGNPIPPPMFVVDGEVVNNFGHDFLDSLGTENIAGIDILADSAQVAKYHAPDSTRGVVIITTKEYAKSH